MKQIYNTLKTVILIFALLGISGNVWALDEYATVTDFNGSTTYSGSNMNSILGNNFSKKTGLVTFVINDVSYLAGTGLTYGFQNANSTVNSQFSWSAEPNYEVAVTKVSIGLKGYQVKLSSRLKSATGQFSDGTTTGSPVDCKTNALSGGASTVSISASPVKTPLTLQKTTGSNSTDYSITTVTFTYKVTHREYLFGFSASAISNNTSYGTASASVDDATVQAAIGVTSASTTARFTASPKTGCQFLGWYDNSSYTGTPVSTELTYNVDLSNTTAGSTTSKTLYAKFDNKQNQTITWNQTIGNKIRSNTVTLSATASSNLTVTYTASPSDLVSISGNVVTCLKAGTVTITANQSGNEHYYASSNTPQKSFTIEEHAITTIPSATEITYEQKLSNSTLSGGAANVAGTWAWKYPNSIPAAGTANQVAVFTPSSSIISAYPLECNVSVKVNKATPDTTCSIAEKYYVDHAALDLQSMWTREGDGIITYTVASFTPSGKNNENATAPVVSSSRYLSLGQAGKLCVRMEIEEGTNYTSRTVTRDVTILKRANAVKVNGEADYEASVYYDDGLFVTFTSLNDNNPTADYSVKQDEGATFATYYENEEGRYIWTAPTQGKAVWTVTQEEDYKYESASTTMTINVIPAQAVNDCYVLNQTDEQTLTTHINSTGGIQGEPMALSGPGATLTFKAMKSLASAISGLYVQYSSDGVRWDDINDEALSLPPYTYIGGDFEFDISNLDVKYIRFEAKVGATYTKRIKDVRVTRKTYVTPGTNSLTIDKNSNNEYIYSGQTGSAQLTIDWSCANGGNLELYCSDTRFRFEPSVIENVDCNGGTTTVTVYYDANTAEDVEATLYIHNSVYSEQVELTGKARLHTQTINWADDIDVMQEDTSRDDAASAMTTISYVSSNPDVIRVDNNTTLVAVGVGSALITATAAAEGAYAEATDSKWITVTNDQPQYILWNQSLIGLHVGDANVTLNATATSDVEGCTTNGQRTITYTSQDEKVVKIVEGNQLQIVGVGITSITATQAGGEDADGHSYLPVTKDNKVVVTNPSAECDAIIPIAETSASLFDWNTNKPQVQFDIELNPATNGEPRSVSFDCKTEKFSGIWLNGDLILAQRINGGWVDVRNFGVPTTGEYDQYEDIALDRNATAIRFYRPKGGEGYHDIANVVVKKARYIETALDSYSLNTKVGETTTQSVTINYSNVIGPVTFQLSGENNHFAIDNNVENASCGQNGSVTIQLSYTPSAAVAEETDLLTITDGQITTEVAISGSATLTQRSIIWTPTLPATIVSNQTLTLAAICKTEFDLTAGEVHFRLTENSTTGTLNGNVLSFDGAGVVEVQAYVDYDARYNTPTSTVTITVQAAPEYIFTGSGSWEEASEWKSGSVPSENMNIQVTGQLVIDDNHIVNGLTILGEGSVTMVENGKLTINGDSKTTDTYGDLYVKAGGDVVVNGSLRVNDLIIAAEYPATGTAKSGRLEHGENVNVQHNVYFDLTIDPSDNPTFGWYDISVPFAVDAVNGVSRYNKETGMATKVAFGPDYAIIDFDAQQYANGGRGWNYFRGVMQPGKLYSLTVDDEYTGADRNTYRFMKAGGEVTRKDKLPLNQTTSKEATRNNWNGLGNTTLQYAKVNMKTQVFDHNQNRYLTIDANARTFVLGEAFFVQSEEPEMTFTAVNSTVKAIARAARVVDEFVLSIQSDDEEQDRLFLSASEDAREDYQIGHDLLKFGTPTEAKVAQMWSTAYGQQLCDVEMPLRANKATFDISLFAPQAGTYTLAVAQQPTDATLYLTENGDVIWNLSMSAYEVELPQGTTANYGLLLRANDGVQQVTTEISNTETNTNVRKLIIDGQLYILRDGKMYDVQGRSVQK